MSTGEVACSYAAMILHDDGIPITAGNIATLVKAANVKVEPYWPSLFAKLAEKKNLDDITVNVGCGGGGGGAAPVPAAAPAASATAAAPAAQEKKVDEAEEESDDDLGISLFDD